MSAHIFRNVEFFSFINLCTLRSRCTHSGLWSHWSGSPSVTCCTKPVLCSTLKRTALSSILY